MLNNESPEVVTVLNTSIVTAPGSYTMRPITLREALNICMDQTSHTQPIQSAIGHESTADIVSRLLGENLPVCREAYRQPPGARAIVFKLRGRPPEGKILSREEIEAIGYDFFLLRRFTDAEEKAIDEAAWTG